MRRHLAVFLISLLVLSFLTPLGLVNLAQASEPTLSEIFNHLGFTNLNQVQTETFDPGNYTITQYAGFAYDRSDIGCYQPGSSQNLQPRIFSSEAGGKYTVPPLSFNFSSGSEFGLYILTNHGYFSGGKTTWYSQAGLNKDGKSHMLVFQNSTPSIWYIGFEDDSDWDYNDVVVSLQILPPFNSSTTVTATMVAIGMPNHIKVGSPVNCAASVVSNHYAGAPPTGYVIWSMSNDSVGNFSELNCTLSITNETCSSCETTFIGTDNGTVIITATYSGDTYNLGSSGKSPAIIVGDCISIESEFVGDFLSGGGQLNPSAAAQLSLNNTFGVLAQLQGDSITNVSGTIDGVNYNFTPNNSDGTYDITIDMSNLTDSSVLQVVASYADGRSQTISCPLNITVIPLWLASILNAGAQVEKPTYEPEWNNAYEINVTEDYNLPSSFTISVPIEEALAGGSYVILPNFEFGFAFNSTGECVMSGNETGELISIDYGPGSVAAQLNLTVVGDLNWENQNINWTSATFGLYLGVSASYDLPTPYGYTFYVPGYGNVTIGLSATFSFSGNVGAQIVLAPPENNTQEFKNGIGTMIQTISADVSIYAGIAINLGCGVAQISGGGGVTVNVIVNNTQPYVYLSSVTGTVLVDYQVLFWSGTIWNPSKELWPNDTDPDATNFTVAMRYYNTPDYEELTWTNGSLTGTAIHDVYPFTRITSTSSGNDAYILYTSDNVSMPENQSLCWNGLGFDSTSETLTSVPMPSVTNELFFNPTVICLSNGTLLAMWDSIPFSDTVNATSPVDINEVIPQYSCFDTNTRIWEPVENLTSDGVATSYLLSSDPSGCYAVVLEGDNLFSSNQSLVEYNLQNGAEMLNIGIPNCSSIVSFDSSSQLALLKMLDGSYELLNLSSSEYINLPTLDGFQLKDAQFATNSTDSLALLYDNSTSGILSIYNMTSRMTVFNMNVAQDTSFMTLTQTGSDYQLATADSSNLTTSGITNYLIENGTAEQIAFYPMQNITSMGSTSTDNGMLVYTTENYGNSTNPLLNLTLTFITATPVANFTYSPAPTIENSTATFDATNSATTIGDITGYQWNFGDGNVTTTPNPIITHIYALPGTYNVTLTVGNSVNSTGSTWMLVDVLQLPNATFVYLPTMPHAGGTVTFDASDSTSSGTIVSYVWNFGDYNVTTTSNPITTHAYSSGGTYNVTLTITDSDGLKDSTSQILIVYSGPESQIIVTGITTNNTWVYQGRMVNVNVTVSNIGNSSQNVWVTLYYNITAGKSIDSYPIYLIAGQSYTLAFAWNTEGLPCLNYTLTAVATIPTGSNTLSNGTLAVRLMGDVNGDGRINVKDIALVARAFGSTPTSPNWNPAADLNGDGVVNMKDIAIVARNFGQQYS